MTSEDGRIPHYTDNIVPKDKGLVRTRLFGRGGRIVHRMLSRAYYYGDRDQYLSGWVKNLTSDADHEEGVLPPILEDVGKRFEINEIKGFEAGDVADLTGGILQGVLRNPPLDFRTVFPEVFLPGLTQATSERKKLETADSIDLVIIKGIDGRPLTTEEKRRIASLKTNFYPNPFSKKEPRVDISRLFGGVRQALGEGEIDWEICDIKVDFRGNKHKDHKQRYRRQLGKYAHLTSQLLFGITMAEANPVRVQQSFSQLHNSWQINPLAHFRSPDLSILYVATDGTSEREWILEASQNSADVVRDE